LHTQTRRARRGARRKPLVDKGRRGTRAAEGVEVFAVVEKGHIVGTGGLERRDIGDALSPVCSVHQPRAAQSSELVERIGPGAIEEAKIGHAAAGSGAVISSFSAAAPDRPKTPRVALRAGPPPGADGPNWLPASPPSSSAA